MKVRDVMTYGVIGVPESTSIVEAVETMLRSRVSAVCSCSTPTTR